MIPTMRQFSIEQLLDVLDSCQSELGNYFQDSQETSAFFAAQNARDARDFLHAELVVNHYPNQIH